MPAPEAAIAVVTLPSTSGIGADDCTNTWCIGLQADTDLDSALALELAAWVRDFYTVADPGTTIVPGTYLSDVIDRAANRATIDIYNITGHFDGSMHGGPVASLAWTVPAANVGLSYPNEVAIVITLEGEGRSTASVEVPDSIDAGTARDRPKQRLTGRIYFGPLQAHGDEVSGVMRPNATVNTGLRNNVGHLHTGLFGTDPACLGLGIWSRQSGSVSLLEAVSTDNEFDTQRRRGRKATSRSRQLV